MGLLASAVLIKAMARVRFWRCSAVRVWQHGSGASRLSLAVMLQQLVAFQGRMVATPCWQRLLAWLAYSCSVGLAGTAQNGSSGVKGKFVLGYELTQWLVLSAVCTFAWAPLSILA